MNNAKQTPGAWPRYLPRIARPLAYPPMAILEVLLMFLALFAVGFRRFEWAARIVRFAETLPNPMDYSWSNAKVRHGSTPMSDPESETRHLAENPVSCLFP